METGDNLPPGYEPLYVAITVTFKEIIEAISRPEMLAEMGEFNAYLCPKYAGLHDSRDSLGISTGARPHNPHKIPAKSPWIEAIESKKMNGFETIGRFPGFQN